MAAPTLRKYSYHSPTLEQVKVYIIIIHVLMT